VIFFVFSLVGLDSIPNGKMLRLECEALHGCRKSRRI
jgi:hypothetical protein